MLLSRFPYPFKVTCYLVDSQTVSRSHASLQVQKELERAQKEERQLREQLNQQQRQQEWKQKQVCVRIQFCSWKTRLNAFAKNWCCPRLVCAICTG
ncbi:hypothetical protein DPMN_103382 [Dreissena polymorpha]|uniref:Uncharacterized protein n=1 Tax=Dreissena polymorpha TaxID=45954 RepID=A0A9D4HB18_DREPO|nr:hypothetical protein DPMN_103382 [Dreissena polymorpha]